MPPAGAAHRRPVDAGCGAPSQQVSTLRWQRSHHAPLWRQISVRSQIGQGPMRRVWQPCPTHNRPRTGTANPRLVPDLAVLVGIRQQAVVSKSVRRAREMGLLAYPDQDRKVRH